MLKCEQCGKTTCDRPLTLDDEESWDALDWVVCVYCGNNDLCPECMKKHNCPEKQRFWEECHLKEGFPK